jgi:pyrroloquinoline quinone biosynthesis protein E
MIEYARARHIWVRSTTNASLLHLRGNYNRVIDADICELQVSIDGATEETYEKIRVGGKFKTIAKNCIALNQYGRDMDRKRTRMWVVVQKDNAHELELFPALAAELGFERLSYSLDLNDWGQDKWREVNDQVDVHRTLDRRALEALVPLGQRHGVDVTFWFIDDKYDTSDPASLCPWPFERGYVSSDMRFVPCCMIANPDVLELGDARDLTGVWNNNKMAAFRRSHLRGQIPQVCRSCYKSPESNS